MLSDQAKNRIQRTGVQVIISGALATALDPLLNRWGVPPELTALLILFLVVYAQNWAEDHGVSFPVTPDRE